ncbi:MAG: glycosyltransferase family 39 protein [Flavobacteriales bacterium]|nr:glycosyltransferase family 39 protein [Flavobacteriales bacterium]
MPVFVAFIRKHWNEHPLMFVLTIGLMVRLLAMWFARGYLMVDDHFLVMEAAGSWADGFDYNKWLPWTENSVGPVNLSFFYVGIIWLVLEALQAVGIQNPDTQMLIIRGLHAVYSLGIIYYGFRIAHLLAGKKEARMVGLMLALFAFLPNFSVRQLVEMTCLPPLMGMFYFLMKGDETRRWTPFLFAGILAGIAVGIRYQVVLIVAGSGAVALFSKNWSRAILYGVVAGAVFFLTQISDLFLWHKPFAQLWEYIAYNSTEYGNYPNSPWYNYVLTLAGFLVPPVSLLFLFGFFKPFKKHLPFIVPVLLFLVFHSIYPNKQERFILPIIPIIISVGYVGWMRWYNKSLFWHKAKWLHTSLWVLFWSINVMALSVFTFSYTKKSLVESMLWLRERGDCTNFIWEYSHTDHVSIPPRYYLDQWNNNFNQPNSIDPIKVYKRQERNLPGYPPANYILFIENEDMHRRVYQANELYSGITFEKHCEPGFLDRWLHLLNPINPSEDVYIYRINNPVVPSAE